MESTKDHYMEDLSVGQKFSSGPIDVTAEDIMDYAKKYDPQDFHTDPALAKNTIFGHLIASGWHTASLTMRLIIEASPRMKGGMIGRSVERMNWLKPVEPGDKLYFECEILDLRASNSNPERGVMRVKNTTFNQKHEPVLEMDTVVFVPRRPKAA